MKTAYVTEIFKSIQGEGQRVGRPSLFIRLHGCNLKCRGFGMDDGLSNFHSFVTEHHKLIPFKDISDLPLAPTGCDSYVAWAKGLRDLSKQYTSAELIDVIKSHLDGGDIDIVFTGGEPLLHQSFICEVLDMFREYQYGIRSVDVTFETNGTVPLKDNTIKKLMYMSQQHYLTYTFSVSPKLSNSGEPKEKTYSPDFWESLYHLAINCSGCKTAYTKFVVDPNKIDELVEEIKHYNMMVTECFTETLTYLMAVGGTQDMYLKNSTAVAEYCIKHNFLYSPRLHIDLFGNEWGT